MHKQYPYLQDSYIYKTDLEWENRSILKDIDNFKNQRQYVKITLLNWDEEPIKEIQGEISTGSISKTADSPIRRTAQLTCAVDAHSYSVDNGKADFAINKKVFIEIGVKNETPHYQDYPIFWFPEGVFFIGSFAINAGSNSSTTITLGLKDKMAMLNGDVGGTLPATTIFDSMDTQLPDGTYIEKKVLIYNIIQEVVHHYGGEDLSRIVIEGVPLRIRRIMQWTGDTPLYKITTAENSNAEVGSEEGFYEFTLEEPDSSVTYNKYEKGDDVGYIMDDFVIVNDLTGAPGESVTSILDKIKNIIGNYEYFYDVFGVFHFREIKNYYVTTQARTLLDEMAENDYLVEVNNNKSIYTFDDEKLLTSISVTPQYENIKNDYIVEGKTTIGDSNIVYPVRYHLAIDEKPKPIGTDNRGTVRAMVDYTEEIEDMTNQLNQLLASRENSSKSLTDILYKIQINKNSMSDDLNTIDTKDKLLLKYLQNYAETNWSYSELTKPNKLLSEAWLEKTFPQNNNLTLREYLNALPEKENDIAEQLSNIEELQKALKENQDVLEHFTDKTVENFTGNKDIFNNISEVSKTVNNAKRYVDVKIGAWALKEQVLQQQQDANKNSFNSFKQSCVDLYDFIQKLQNDVKDKKKILVGSAENGTLEQKWRVNNYECLVNRSVNGKISFSHNIDYFEQDVRDDDTYTITSNDVTIKKILHITDDKFLYSDGLFFQFLELWKAYHDIEKNQDLAKINQLQNQIAKYNKAQGTFQFIKNSNQGKKYYGIYPTEETRTTTDGFQEMILYTHPRNGVNCAAYVKVVDNLPDVGNFNLVYKEGNTYYYWDGQMYKEVKVLAAYDNAADENKYYAYDWRTKLYLDGLKGVINGTDQGYYFAELSAFWPQVYDLTEQKFFGEKEDKSTHFKTLTSSGTYYLDFLDSISTSFGEWSVKNIGRRSDVIVKEEINCLFQPEIPNVVILPANSLDLSVANRSSSDTIFTYNNRALESNMTLEELRNEAKINFYPWTQVDSSIYSQLLTGGYKNGAFDQIKYELYLHTRYQKAISMTSIPVFYLEPNNRITINDTTTNTYGDFVVQSINLTLGPGANMSTTCNEIAERF